MSVYYKFECEKIGPNLLYDFLLLKLPEAVELAPNEKSKVLATLGLAGSSGTLKPEDVVSLGFPVSGTELPEVFASFAAPKAKLRDGWGCAVAEVVVVIAFDAVILKKNQKNS